VPQEICRFQEIMNEQQKKKVNVNMESVIYSLLQSVLTQSTTAIINV